MPTVPSTRRSLADQIQQADGTNGTVADLRFTHTSYDALGRVRETSQGFGLLVEVQEVQPGIFETTFPEAYDDLAHIGATTLTYFDEAGRVERTTTYDLQGGVQESEVNTHFTYDDAGRQKVVWQTDFLDNELRRTATTYDDRF